MRLSRDSLEALIREELDIFLRERSDKAKRCVGPSGKGSINALHGTDGRFSSKEDATSYSVRQGTGDCSKGQTKENPHQWTKVKCGRENPNDDTDKAKWRCKDGKEHWKPSVREVDEPELITDAQMEAAEGIDPRKIKRFCNGYGFRTMKDLMLYINNLKRAEKGDLLNKPKQD